ACSNSGDRCRGGTAFSTRWRTTSMTASRMRTRRSPRGRATPGISGMIVREPGDVAPGTAPVSLTCGADSFDGTGAWAPPGTAPVSLTCGADSFDGTGAWAPPGTAADPFGCAAGPFECAGPSARRGPLICALPGLGDL